MIENDQHPDDVTDQDPILAGYETFGTWTVCQSGRDPDEEGHLHRVTAFCAEMIDPDGAYRTPAVEVLLPDAGVDPAGALRVTAETAHALAATLHYAADVAEHRTVAR